jgi:hypothetical protein
VNGRDAVRVAADNYRKQRKQELRPVRILLDEMDIEALIA